MIFQQISKYTYTFSV